MIKINNYSPYLSLAGSIDCSGPRGNSSSSLNGKVRSVNLAVSWSRKERSFMPKIWSLNGTRHRYLSMATEDTRFTYYYANFSISR